MLTEEIMERSLALRQVTGRRADGPHGLPPAGQTGVAAKASLRANSRGNAGKLRKSRFAISFKKDPKSGELRLVRQTV